MSLSLAASRKKPATRLPRWRRWLIVVCLLGFLVFFFPVFGRIVNIANLSAMAGFLLLAAVFRWWPGFLALLKRFWSRPWSRVLLLLCGAAILSVTLLLAVLCGRVVSRLHAAPDRPCATVIVLGCQVRGTTPSLLLRYRIQTAADYLTDHPEAVAILSGGQGSDENISEAECMYRSLTRMGIDPARLYREDTSTVTLENIRNSMALMEREGLQAPAVIVTNNFHICRALEMAEDLGLPAQGLAARSNWYSLPTYVLREALALVQYGLS